MSRTKHLPTVVVSAIIMMATASPVLAQPRGVYPVSLGVARPGADDLRAEAMTLVLDTERYAEAAALLVRAAALRDGRDAMAVKDLVLAGKLYAYANDLRAARTNLQDGAVRALAFGDVVTAAHAYLDAAFIAVRQRDAIAVRELTASAERLTSSPHMNAEQRREIMLRINPARAH